MILIIFIPNLYNYYLMDATEHSYLTIHSISCLLKSIFTYIKLIVQFFKNIFKKTCIEQLNKIIYFIKFVSYNFSRDTLNNCFD